MTGNLFLQHTMDENLKEILIIIGMSTIGVVCSYLVSPVIAKGLNEVSVKVLEQPLNVEVTQKYVFFTLSALCIGQGLYSILQIALDIQIQTLFMSSGLLLDHQTLEAIVPDLNTFLQLTENQPENVLRQCWSDYWEAYPAIKQTIIHTNVFHGPFQAYKIETYPINTYQTSNQVWLQDQQFLLEIAKPVSTFLDSNYIVNKINAVNLQRTFENGMLLSNEMMRQMAPVYRECAEHLAKIPDADLIELSPWLREYYLIKHIDIMWYGQTNQGFPNVDVQLDRLKTIIDLQSDHAINIRLLESIKRFGSGAGGISKAELLLRSTWGHLVLNNDINVYTFIDGSNCFPLYSNNEGMLVEKVLWKSRFLAKFA
jgi:hypothetical protein